MIEVEYTDVFGDWWDALTEAEQESVAEADRLHGEYLNEIADETKH